MQHMSEPANIVWEITAEELRDRYRQYAPAAMPVVVGVTASLLLYGWWENRVGLTLLILIPSYVGVIGWMIMDYRSHPHRYELGEDGVTITKGNSMPRQYLWSAFMGYAVSTDASGRAMQVRRRRVVDAESLEKTMDTMHQLFGPTYYLIRPWHWYTVWAFWGSVWVSVEPEVAPQAQVIISSHLPHITMERINNQGSWVHVLLGFLLVAVMIFFAWWTSPI